MVKKNGLSARLMVAAIGIPIILIPTYTGGVLLSALIGVISVIAMLEYYRLQESLGQRPIRWIGIIAGVGVILLYAAGGVAVMWISLFLIAAFLIVAAIGTLSGRSHQDIIASFTAIVYIPLLAGTFILIRNSQFLEMEADSERRWLALSIWGTLWIGDTAAYGFGKAFGRHRPFPQISPKKTVEGFTAGFLGAILFSLIWWSFDLARLDIALAVGIAAGTIGQIGDLFESKLKRDAGVKDSGTFLPGHGGALDRFDSFIVTAPAVAIYLTVRVYLFG